LKNSRNDGAVAVVVVVVVAVAGIDSLGRISVAT